MSAHKLMLLGDIGVGKSSIVNRLVFERFDKTYKPTIGVDIYRYEVPRAASEAPVSFIVWDTDGNFGETIFRHVYLRDAAGAMIVADLSRPETFEAAERLYSGFREALPGRHAMVLLNKSDLISEDTRIALPAALQKPDVLVRQTSAKTGNNVQQAFHDTADIIQTRS